MGTAMITGGTAGIGWAFARAFARRGLCLILVARTPERLDQAADSLRHEFGVAVRTVVADLSRRDDQARVAALLDGSDSSSNVDVLVNSAGFSVRPDLLEPDLRGYDEGVEVMQRAVMVLSGAAARAMNKRGRGWIINMCSVASFLTQSGYTAVKAWTLNYSESLSVQMADTGVLVTALVPGWVRTEFHARAGISGSSIPGPLWIDPDLLVEKCLKDVARGRTVSVPLLRWKLIVQVLRSAPRPVIHRISTLLTSRRSAEG